MNMSGIGVEEEENWGSHGEKEAPTPPPEMRRVERWRGWHGEHDFFFFKWWEWLVLPRMKEDKGQFCK